MNIINKFLCKYFDWEKKGYVTIRGFIFYTIIYTLILLLIYSVFNFISIGAYWSEDFINNKEINVLSFQFVGALLVTLILIIIFIFIIGFIYIITDDILKIKIAKCESKNNKTNLEKDRANK